jgi:heme exporter protein C
VSQSAIDRNAEGASNDGSDDSNAVERAVVRSAAITGPLALLGLAVWAYYVWAAPIEAAQGIIQKIFYVHVPFFPPAYLGFFITALCGAAFLSTRRDAWDRLAFASAEVGLVFLTLIMVTGPIWAKPAWGHWWVWDLRLTTTLVLWFVYLAYLFLRGFAQNNDQARVFSSIYGIAGTIVIPFVYFAVDIAGDSTMHPRDPREAGLPREMLIPLQAGFLSFLLLFFYLWSVRTDIARLEARQALAADGQEIG